MGRTKRTNIPKVYMISGYNQQREKRARIHHPEKSSKKEEKVVNKAVKNNTLSNENDNSTVINQIDDALVRAVEDRFHFKPSIGMSLKCKVTGKSYPFNGTLEFLGRVTNLPKRSNIVVAGLKLDLEEDLGTDGSFLGKRYFSAPPKRGYFVPFKNCMVQ